MFVIVKRYIKQSQQSRLSTGVIVASSVTVVTLSSPLIVMPIKKA